MRTTVTLDHDAEQLLRQAMQQTGESFKVALNRAIRRGLADTVPQGVEEPFVVEAQDMGVQPGVDIANIHDLETELEVEAYLEGTRKLEQERNNSQSTTPDGSAL
ncbi:MAG: FHIPEP family type III secretion protein [Planctomycetes bacterium]|nr:FHIPEP family type III secretion protein [Planctomycetota bacterium]